MARLPGVLRRRPSEGLPLAVERQMGLLRDLIISRTHREQRTQREETEETEGARRTIRENARAVVGVRIVIGLNSGPTRRTWTAVGVPSNQAGVVKLADARDSKSRGVYAPCGFDSHLRHHQTTR